ncbi:response regulator [Noviherbaspirillum denitrificans]|uniref:Response regulator receiver protein n=1 Tax=Noviherbaspirillum denitrificans TaxID=1968433 RepID=A0A254TPE4_9BURK|nr:response regulator [Noviherbaspirillum denitrificans]OWW21588.1 response regulator receiver protein [Noviherbaspirillum denitrificans]
MQANAPATILIVDDEERNRKLLEVFMQAEGYRTITVGEGSEAVVLAARERPDLVLLDMMMPGMDGFEVARTLKAEPELRHIPLIVVSSLDDIASRRRVLSAGADEVIHKPVDRWQLSQLVTRLLKASSGG